ncbi:MAG TPA: N-acetyltransferase [Rhodospirillaceae bacterium]|nr:N-acetyltransferase [Rhodospirillaceae bacterium]
MSKSIEIRPIEQNDFPQWLPLWDGNNTGQRDEAVTTQTWLRLSDPASSVHGLCALRGGEMIGLVHYVLHPTTGSLAPVCYMQDLYVDPTHRGKGVARKLVEHLVQIHKREKWARMYWIAEADNKAAQKLYKNIGVKIDFTVHVLL